MNAMRMARSAYSGTGASTRTTRDIEYEVFARITRNISQAIAADKPRFSSLVAALHENRKLWNILAEDVADQGNDLPDTLRARIFFLAQFTNHETENILSGKGNAKVLVDINMAVMRGLRYQQNGTNP